MLDGQLQLTGTEFPGARAARPSRSMLWVGLLCLVLAGCASRTTRAPVVDLNTQPAPATPSAAGGATYVVKPGDTLYGISRANGVDIESLKRWNNIADSNHLAVGQVLKLSAPASGSAGAPVNGAKPAPATPVKPADTRIEPTPLPPPGEQPAPTQQAPATTPPPANP
ncbi:LysM peptidoglycan-binding domain-containing protein, partial [Bordetella bronchialis]